MSSMGLSYTILGQRIMAKVFAYGIRDIKDGVEDNSKLVIGRVIEEINNERNKYKVETFIVDRKMFSYKITNKT